MAKKQYNKEFKEDALCYQQEHPELTVAAICRNLGISDQTFYKWKREAKANNGEVQFTGSGNYASEEQKEIADLKRKLKNTEDALAILKKALGILTKE